MNLPSFQSGGLPRCSSGSSLPDNISAPDGLLVADDLTGACDSGSPFVKAGFTVCVRLSIAETEKTVAADVQVFSAETRNLGSAEAKARIASFDFLRRFSGSLLFQKVDSAGRGHPGEEMLAIAAMSRREAIVYAPAFPAAVRLVRDGILRIRDFTGQESEVNLPGLIPVAAQSRVQLISVGSEEEVRARMLEAQAMGKNIWLCDAATQDDLVRIARAASALSLRLLWAGSAGLAEAVAGLSVITRRADVLPATIPSTQGRTLVVCGTDHPVTVAQLRRLEPHSIALPPESGLSLPAFDCGVARIDWAATSEESFRKLWQRFHGSGLPPVRSLVLTGGDTAMFVLQSLHAERLWLGGEVEPGIPWSIADGGLAEGCIVITKSGGFGAEDSLVKAAGFCQKVQR